MYTLEISLGKLHRYKILHIENYERPSLVRNLKVFVTLPINLINMYTLEISLSKLPRCKILHFDEY